MKIETPAIVRDLDIMLFTFEHMVLGNPLIQGNVEEDASIVIARVMPALNGVDVSTVSKMVALSAIIRTMISKMEKQVAAMPEPVSDEAPTPDKGPNAG